MATRSRLKYSTMPQFCLHWLTVSIEKSKTALTVNLEKSSTALTVSVKKSSTALTVSVKKSKTALTVGVKKYSPDCQCSEEGKKKDQVHSERLLWRHACHSMLSQYK